MLTGIIYQLISIFSFGTSNVLWKFPQKYFSVFKIIVIRTLVSVVLFSIVAIIFHEQKGELSDWIGALIIGFTSFLGLVFYNMSLKNSKVSHTITVTSISALFGVLTAIILYNEKFTWNLGVSFFLIVTGLFLLGSKKPILHWGRSTFYAILAAIFWGITFALFKIPVEAIGSYNFSLVLECAVLVGALLLLMGESNQKSSHQPDIKTYLIIACTGVLGFFGVLFYNLAVARVPISTLSVMGVFTPVISIVISHLILQERFTVLQYVGMGCTLTGVVIISI
jgi:drug/metabolite transporter (DMT)-like permease